MASPRGDDDNPLSNVEHRAVTDLQALAKRWPKSLRLASMDGSLHVLRNDDFQHLPDGGLNPDAICADIPNIPNTGGAW